MKQKNRKKWWGLLLLLLLGVAGYSLMDRSATVVTVDTPSEGAYVEEMDSDQLQRFLQDKADDQYVRLTIDPDLYFDQSDGLGRVAIQNSPSNQYSLRMESYLQKDGRKIYDSGLVDPKEMVTTGKLLAVLPKGEYAINNLVAYYDRAGTKQGESSVMGHLTIAN